MRVLTRMWATGLAIAAGLGLALCFAPFDLSVMVWLGLIPFFVALWAGGGETKRRGWFGFRTGFVAGAAFWLLNLKWITEVSGIGWIAISLYLALYFALWGAFVAGVGNPWRRGESGTENEPELKARGIAAKLRERQPTLSKQRRSLREARRVVRFAALNAFWWCGLEWVRGWMLTGFSWNGLGVAFHDTPVIAQSADLIGATGLSFVPVFVMGAIVQIGRGFHEEVRRGRLRPHWDFGVAIGVLVFCFVYGVWRLQGQERPESVPLHVLMVQLNIPQEADRQVWLPEEVHIGYEGDTLEALRILEERNAERVQAAMLSGMSGEAIPLDVPDWVVWPESAMREALHFTAEGRQAFGPLTRHSMEVVGSEGVFTLLFGMNEAEALEENGIFPRKEDGAIYNSLVALSSGEPKVRTYRKQHLVMFGEEIPYREYLPFLERLFEMSAGVRFGRGFSKGEGDEPMRLPFGAAESGEIAIIPSICFEDTVPRVLRKYVPNGGQVIVNVTNDGWFGESEAAAQHFANSKFRAIEIRRPMVRCSNTGVSAVVGTDGTVVDPVNGEQRVLVDENGNHLTRGWLYATAYVPVNGPVTLYARFGDWFAVLGFVVGLGWWLAGRFMGPETRGKPRREKDEAVAPLS